MSLHRNVRLSTQRIKAVPGSLCFGKSVSSDWFGEGQYLDLHCEFRVTKWSVTMFFQVLPVLSLCSEFSALACCSQSGPSGSHCPWTGPFSSSLDGRSASTPSESYTQRCFCQPQSPALKEAVMVRLYTVLTVILPQNIIPVAIFLHNSLHLFQP